MKYYLAYQSDNSFPAEGSVLTYSIPHLKGVINKWVLFAILHFLRLLMAATCQTESLAYMNDHSIFIATASEAIVLVASFSSGTILGSIKNIFVNFLEGIYFSKDRSTKPKINITSTTKKLL